MTVTEWTAGAGDGAGAETDDAAERGLTEIADRVVEKVAARLAGEVDGVVREQGPGGLRAALPGLGGGGGIVAHAAVGRRTARLSVTLDVRYPQPAAEVTDRVREHLTEGLARLTGLEVESLVITVRRLVVASRSPRRRVA